MILSESYVFASLAIGAICALLAKSNGRSPLKWFIGGALFNLLALAALLYYERRKNA